MSTGAGSPARQFVAGTRGSRLAVWQTTFVLRLLRSRWPDVTFSHRVYATRGDAVSQKPLPEIGGKGVFTESLERALSSGEVDFAVHSLKDLPTQIATGLTIAAVVGPRNPGEALVSRGRLTLSELPRGAVIGTSSLRRRAQVLAVRPDAVVRDIRGNVETRIEKVKRGDFDATVLAAAGIERLGLGAEVVEHLDAKTVLPAPGQGAIAVECRVDDERTVALLSAINDREVAGCTLAERSFLEALGGGCSAPVGALAVKVPGAGEGVYRMVGRVVAPDGSIAVEVEGEGAEPKELGLRLADLAREQGASRILGETLSGRFAGAATRGPSPRTAATARSGALAGRRIVVTRPRSQARALVESLELQGAEVIHIPVIEIRPLLDSGAVGRALEVLDEFRWIVFTSGNAVEQLVAAWRQGGLDPARLSGKLAAVGRATAAVLAELGLQADFVSAGHTGAELAAELPEVTGKRVLFPCAEQHTEGLPQGLGGRGARVTILPVYRTETIPIGREAIEELDRGVDLVVFTSGSTVRGFLEALREGDGGELLRRLFERARIACIGPSTASVVEAAGLRPDIVAEEHTGTGLVAAILDAELSDIELSDVERKRTE